jgi:cytoskeleton protein RodZ
MTKVTRLTINDGSGTQNRRIHLREISDDLEAPLETVGQDLRTARLRRGDDLASVSRILKIRREHLEALEEDRLEALPGRAYAVGFVRSYAEYLGLDAAQCVERYKLEIAGRSDNITPVHVIEEDEHRRLPQGWVIVAGVVLLLLAYGAYRLVVSADEMLTQPVTPAPPQAAVTKKSVEMETKSAVSPAANSSGVAGAAAPATTAGNSATIANQLPGTVGATGSAIGVVPSPTQPPIGANGTSSFAQPGQTVELPGPQVAALPPGQVYGALNRNPRVILRVHVATRILVQGPKKAVFINRTLKPGDTYQVPNMVGLTLTTPNGGAIELDLDGQAMGFAGREQQMTEALSLDPQSIVDRYNRQ